MKVFVIAISAAFIVFSLAECAANKGGFVMVNNATEPIARASVTVCGQTIELKNVQPEENASGSYKVMSDSHYDVTVEFQSGSKLQKAVGYVTNGFDFHHEIVVTDTNIEITQSRIVR